MRSDTGLLGVYYVTELDKVMEAQWVSVKMFIARTLETQPDYQQVVMREFQTLCHNVTDEAVEVAKAQVKSTIVGQLDAGLAQVSNQL